MEVRMDQLKRCGALTAVVFTLALAACGGSPSAAVTETSAAVQVEGVSTPDSVSVVTATNVGD
jgi:hypothetical protein